MSFTKQSHSVHDAPSIKASSKRCDEHFNDELEDNDDPDNREMTLSDSREINQIKLSIHDQTDPTYVRNLPNENIEEDQEIANRRRRKLKDWFILFSFDGNEEARGYALDCVPRGAIQIGSSIFLSTALVHLARKAAGCPTEPLKGETKLPDCHNHVYGFRPSSLLSIYAVALGLCCSFFVPFVGATLDHIEYRRAVGRVSVIVITIIVFFQSFISESTWFVVAILAVILAFADRVHACVIYAYIPEITRDKDKLAQYTAGFHIIEHLSMVLFLISMVVVTAATGIGDDDVLSARVSQIAVFIVCTFGFGYAWTMLLGPRPASHELPEGSSVWTIGFTHIYSTFKKVLSQKGTFKWLLMAVSFSYCAKIALAAALITYVTDTIKFTTTELGISILIMLASTIIGCKASAFITKKTNPLLIIKISLMLWVSLPCLVGATLVRPGQQLLTYAFAGAIGFAGGLKAPAEQTLICQVVPKGREAEMMGIFVFFSQILTWLPPIVFTSMNEAGIDIRICIVTFSVYFLIGLILYVLLGSYNDVIVHFDAECEQVETRSEDGVTTASNEVNVDSNSKTTDCGTEERPQLDTSSNSV